MARTGEIGDQSDTGDRAGDSGLKFGGKKSMKQINLTEDEAKVLHNFLANKLLAETTWLNHMATDSITAHEFVALYSLRDKIVEATETEGTK